MAFDFAAVAASLGRQLRTRISPAPAVRVCAGQLGEAYRWESSRGALFVKLATATALPVLRAEAEGLEELRRAHAVRVPEVIASGTNEEAAYLALEWLELGAAAASSEEQLGERLARLHRVHARSFGWHRSNTIGATAQENAPLEDWTSFFRIRRLGFQLELARRNGHAGRVQQRGAELLERMPELLAGHMPRASLLHGDLWGGNWGALRDGEPVVFDPAVYYGDRETDLAMTRLFGGFGPRFYAAYERAWPLAPGATRRVRLYNLYHVLNHLNLFGGGGYLRQAESMIDCLLAELGR